MTFVRFDTMIILIIILIQKRKGSKLWPGYYALPAGHIDEGENQYDALVREAKEELGITIEIDKVINSYVVLRRNFFKIDGKQLEPYVDYYFEIHEYKEEVNEQIIKIAEKEGRSKNKQIEYILKEYIEKYNKENKK